MARGLNLPVVMVVGIRLGCLNHALLTAQAIEQSGLKLGAWVANCIDPTLISVDEQIDYLSSKLGRAPLVRLGWQQNKPLSHVELINMAG